MSTRTAELIGFIALTAAFGVLTATNADPLVVMVAVAVVLVVVLISAGKPHSGRESDQVGHGTISRVRAPVASIS